MLRFRAARILHGLPEMLRAALIASSLAACVPPSSAPSYVYAVPVVPLYAYPPPPFAYSPPPPSPSYFVYQPPVVEAEVQLETPSLAVRALSGKISAAASTGDCQAAIAAGDELEKLHADSHHAMLAIDQRYAACIRGF